MDITRKMYFYLSDVTAATAEGLLSLKSTSKAERKRQLLIVRNTLTNLRVYGEPFQTVYETSVFNRLVDIVTRYAI